MTEQTDFLKQMISVSGLSGYEAPVARIIADAWQPLVTRIEIGRLGGVHGLKSGVGSEPRPSILIATHMDAVGLLVTRIKDGFLHFTRIGGIDRRILPGQLVLVHGQEDLPGVIVQPPASLLPPEIGNNPVPMDYLLIDTGLPPARLEKLVKIGDTVSFAQPPLELTGDSLAGHTLDNRASVAALTFCLQELQQRIHSWDVGAVATVQEEITTAGAKTSAYQIHPDMAVVIDVTFAKGPGASDYNTFQLGRGPTLCWGPNIHPYLYKTFKETAERIEIPYQIEPMAGNSGTDAIAIQISNEGIPCIVIGIPLRYMHTPVEMVSLKDIRRVGRLLAEFITHLDVDYLKKIDWNN